MLLRQCCNAREARLQKISPPVIDKIYILQAQLAFYSLHTYPFLQFTGFLGGVLQSTWQSLLQFYSLEIWHLQFTGFKYAKLQSTEKSITPPHT